MLTIQLAARVRAEILLLKCMRAAVWCSLARSRRYRDHNADEREKGIKKEVLRKRVREQFPQIFCSCTPYSRQPLSSNWRGRSIHGSSRKSKRKLSLLPPPPPESKTEIFRRGSQLRKFPFCCPYLNWDSDFLLPQA
jgi:hypothetical protein